MSLDRSTRSILPLQTDKTSKDRIRTIDLHMRRTKKKFFSALQASVWYKNKGGGGPLLDPFLPNAIYLEKTEIPGLENQMVHTFRSGKFRKYGM